MPIGPDRVDGGGICADCVLGLPLDGDLAGTAQETAEDRVVDLVESFILPSLRTWVV